MSVVVPMYLFSIDSDKSFNPLLPVYVDSIITRGWAIVTATKLAPSANAIAVFIIFEAGRRVQKNE